MAKKERTRDTAADYARRSNAISRMGRRPRVDVPGGAAAEPASSQLAPTATRDKPVPRPRVPGGMPAGAYMDAPGSRTDPGMTREEMERGSSAPGSSMRPMPRRFKEGGDVDGFPDLNKDGKVTKADVLKGRGVEGFEMGGMVRGCKAGQMSGKKFSGTF